MRSAKSSRSAVRPGVARVGPRHDPVGEVTARKSADATQSSAGRAILGTPSSMPLPDEERAGQREQRVERRRGRSPTSSRRAVRTQEARAAGTCSSGGGLGGDVDVGLVVGRRQRVDGREQLGRAAPARMPPPRAARRRRRIPPPPPRRPRPIAGRREHERRACRFRRRRSGPQPTAVTPRPRRGSSVAGGRRASSSGPGEQRAVQRASAAISSSWVPVVDHAAAVDDDDAVGEAQRRAAVGDEDRRAAAP